ncbi:transposase family protein [Gemmata sp. JC673]|uniref:Transposase family protein n=1 Tax=Gemmata algarum TaxID=2975278 RepID=A0ABU5F8S6_9BACT|nr:transposase family protein [Gemmata algarum]MDY3563660.1 transposase family protein [Gemmata algarum]
MIARLDNLRKQRAVFEHLTGLTVAAFDALARDVAPVVEAGATTSGAAPRRKPQGKGRSPEDRKCNRAFRRRRIVVEHAIGRLYRFRAVTHVHRHRGPGTRCGFGPSLS